MIAQMRTLANFFQELAVACKHEPVDRQYLKDLFDSVIRRYGSKLKGFVMQFRKEQGDDAIYKTFTEFVAEFSEQQEPN